MRHICCHRFLTHVHILSDDMAYLSGNEEEERIAPPPPVEVRWVPLSLGARAVPSGKKFDMIWQSIWHKFVYFHIFSAILSGKTSDTGSHWH